MANRNFRKNLSLLCGLAGSAVALSSVTQPVSAVDIKSIVDGTVSRIAEKYHEYKSRLDSQMEMEMEMEMQNTKNYFKNCSKKYITDNIAYMLAKICVYQFCRELAISLIETELMFLNTAPLEKRILELILENFKTNARIHCNQPLTNEPNNRINWNTNPQPN